MAGGGVIIKEDHGDPPEVVSDGEDPCVVSDDETAADMTAGDDSDEVINAAEVTATVYLDCELSEKDSEDLLRRHEDGWYRCPVCGLQFKTEGGTRRHIQGVHFNQRQYTAPPEARAGTVLSCDYCETKMDDERSLLIHTKEVHQLGKCDLCEDVMKDDLLDTHLTNHCGGNVLDWVGDSAVRCRICQKLFKAAEPMRPAREHYRSVHLRIRTYCSSCSLLYSPKAYRNHIRKCKQS